MHFKMYSRIPYILMLTYIHYGVADFMTKNADNYVITPGFHPMDHGDVIEYLSSGGHDEVYFISSGTVRAHPGSFPVRWLLEEGVHYKDSFLLQKIGQPLTPGIPGPFYVEWEHYDACRGPKLANLTSFSTKLTKQSDGTYRGKLNMTFYDQTRLEEFRISVYTIKEKSKTLLWNYIVNKPCQHYMLAAFINTEFVVQNCAVKKGEYILDLNLTSLMMKFLGNSFFYGEYLFKVVVTSKKGNIICLIFDPKFKKKVEN